MESAMDLRVGDREREETAEALRHHAAEGRLDPEELDERMGAAYAARTQADLDKLTSDLPARQASPAKRERSLPEHTRRLIYGTLAADLAAVAIWAAGGQGDFWPKWVFILTAVILVRKLLRGPREAEDQDSTP